MHWHPPFVKDPCSGYEYYVNNVTGESQWERSDAVAGALERKPSVLGQLSAEWEECDDGQGRIYYYNLATGQSQWERPAAEEEEGGGTRTSSKRRVRNARRPPFPCFVFSGRMSPAT